MIRNKYDRDDPPVSAAPSASPGSPKRGQTGPFRTVSSMKLMRSHPQTRASYVFEHFVPKEQLLDPTDHGPNLEVLFHSYLSEQQQRRLLRKMEREQVTNLQKRNKEEAERRAAEEIQRRRAAESRECDELRELETRLENITVRLDTLSFDRRREIEAKNRLRAAQEEAVRKREAQRLRTGKLWALYEAAHPKWEEEYHDFLRETSPKSLPPDSTGGTPLAQRTVSLSEIVVSASPTNANNSSSPPTEPTNSGSPVSRVERARERRAKLKKLFEEAEQDDDVEGVAAVFAERSTPASPLGRVKPRVVVQL